VNYVNYYWSFDISWLNKAEELVRKAQTIEPNLPEYYSTLIQIYLLKELYFNIDTKKAVFELAEQGIKEHPHHARLNSIVGYCYYMKFGEEGNEADFKRAIEYKEKNFWLNPYTLGNVVYAELLMLNREFHKAIEVCNILKKHDSSQLAIFSLGDIYYYSGNLDKSEALFQQFGTSPIGFKIPSLFYLAMIAAQKKEIEKARTLIQRINLFAPEKFEIFDNEFKLASAHIGLGEKEKGYEYLESFFNDPITQKDRHIYIKYVNLDKNFDSVREEERFKKIIKRR
jgi:tetratricopeptide (TPR) repeat protein